MNPIFFATFLSLGALVSASAWGAHDDGQWRGEGLSESQDWGQWDHGSAWAAPWAYAAAPGAWAHNGWAHNGWAGNGWAQAGWAHGAAPLGPDGRVVDTPEVAHAKSAHLAAKAAAVHGAPALYAAHVPAIVGGWAHGAAPLGPDGRVVDTPEVAHAKAAHLQAKAAAGAHGWW